jgi:hypothetical protein
LHISAQTPGTLDDARRHSQLSQGELDRMAAPIVESFLLHADPRSLLCVAHDGIVSMRTWMTRPTAATKTRDFDDHDVFEAPLLMTTPRHARGGWW